MSKYIINIGSSIVNALDGVPSSQPALVAGYWTNRDFWLSEFRHLAAVVEGYEHRLEIMHSAHDHYLLEHGGPFNRDEYGRPYQEVTPTSSGERQRILGAARTSLRELADRALNLRIIAVSEYDEFINQLRAI